MRKNVLDVEKQTPQSHEIATLSKAENRVGNTMSLPTPVAELKAEVIKAIRGESKFSPELLNELIAQAEKDLIGIEAARNEAKQEIDRCKYRIEEMQVKYDEVISWTELYDEADFAAKKMIVANLINRIEVGTDYQIHIDLNIDLEHYNIQLDFCSYRQNKTA